MTQRPRRTPHGTQPPIISATEPSKSVSGIILEKTDVTPKVDADEEHAVVVQIDDSWLERLDLPPE
ncbi:MAG: hypothetical protein M4D80_38245 [Myxococcota bacterium]|nr:hypothetical protein [Deltaproteobacteria bacterium]MDQ3341036.1 hypothetical protein [Myxococcota bacterium]